MTAKLELPLKKSEKYQHSKYKAKACSIIVVIMKTNEVLGEK